jgi:hypothetical protein
MSGMFRSLVSLDDGECSKRSASEKRPLAATDCSVRTAEWAVLSVNDQLIWHTKLAEK